MYGGRDRVWDGGGERERRKKKEKERETTTKRCRNGTKLRTFDDAFVFRFFAHHCSDSHTDALPANADFHPTPPRAEEGTHTHMDTQ